MTRIVFREDRGPGIIDFLMARIDEDETTARESIDHGDAEAYVSPHHARWWPARVLAECDAKRAMVAELARLSSEEHADITRLAKLLVLPYADHPDYREEWRP